MTHRLGPDGPPQDGPELLAPDIRQVEWDHPDAAALRAAQESEIRDRYEVDEPEPGVHPSAADMTCFFVAYVDGEPAACGGMRAIDAEHGEIKRMYVVPEHRGHGLAQAILRTLENDARARGWNRVVLETGTKQPEAQRLYEREGYTSIPLFGDYVGETTSLCYQKVLTREPTRRIGALDGLRGVAALIVLVHHSLLLNPALSDLAIVLGTQRPTFGTLGWFAAEVPVLALEAVLVFFVLSGLVVTLPALRSGFDWLAYYPRRIVRLLVPVLGSLILAFLLAVLTPQDPATAGSGWAAAFSFADPDPFMIPRGAELFEGDTSLNSSLWTLRYELLFSVLLPVYVVIGLATRRWWLGVAFLGMVAVALSGHVGSRVWIYLPVFLLGALIAVSLPGLSDRVRRMPRARVNLAGIACLVLIVGLLSARAPGLAWMPTGPVFDEVSTTLPIVSAGLLVFVVVLWRPLGSLLEIRPIRWLGRVSFSLYLVQAPIVLSANAVLISWPWYLRALIAFPITLIAAELFTRFVEAPAHRWSKTVGRWSRSVVDRGAVPRR
jgi:peptidoglycan/LPS O-acetylase OafA/YrhL/GNAT superfamily N-acetyltransferase